VPTPASILLAIAAVPETWFPARFAAAQGVPRDQLDDPLAELRLAGLVRIAEWVKGVGQGYAITPEGTVAAADPAALERLTRSPTAAPAPGSESTSVAEAPPPDGAAAEISSDSRDTELLLNPPVVVPALLMTNALWFFVCAVYSIRWGLTPARALSEGHSEVLLRFGAVNGADLLAGEWWRLFTCCFVHIGVLHLIGNLFALAMMGPLAELLWGRGRLLLIYFVSGLAGSALAMSLRPDTILAGASGAIWGIQMSLFAWLFTFRRHLPPDLANDWFRRLCVVFVLNAGISFLPNVSWEGHLGGGLAGFLTAGLLNAARFGDRQRRVLAWLMLAFLPVLFVAGLAGAMDAKGMPGWQRLRQRLAATREAEQRRKIHDAESNYRTNVVPRLLDLAPNAVSKVETEAGLLAHRKERPPERVIMVKMKIAALKSATEVILTHTPSVPLGSEDLDRLIASARALAAARERSFDLLLALFDGVPPPSGPWPAWDAWQTASREADRLWFEAVPK
jgi:membrane associated rhomboid family serine protease